MTGRGIERPKAHAPDFQGEGEGEEKEKENAPMPVNVRPPSQSIEETQVKVERPPLQSASRPSASAAPPPPHPDVHAPRSQSSAPSLPPPITQPPRINRVHSPPPATQPHSPPLRAFRPQLESPSFLPRSLTLHLPLPSPETYLRAIATLERRVRGQGVCVGQAVSRTEAGDEDESGDGVDPGRGKHEEEEEQVQWVWVDESLRGKVLEVVLGAAAAPSG